MDNDTSNIIGEMQAALTANIDYLSQNGNSQIKIRNGELLQTVGDMFSYQFDLEFLQNIETDADIEVRIGGSSANGKVTAVNDNTVTVEVDKNLGQKVAEATLIISSYYLLQLLKERLEKIESGEVKLSSLATELFDESDPDATPQLDYKPPAKLKSILNNYQTDALQLALGNSISFIWGPPGTGKTQTIASIIEGFLSQGKSVLLLSHTNKATDEALCKTVDYLEADNEDYQDGKIIRFGQITDILKDKYVTPAAIAEKNGKGIKKEIARLELEISKLQNEMLISTSAIKIYDNLYSVEANIANIKQYIIDKQKDALKHKDDIKYLKSSNSSLKNEIEVFEAKGAIARLFTSRKPEEIQNDISHNLRLINKKSEQVDVIIASLVESKEKYDTLNISKEALSKELPLDSYEYYKSIIDDGGLEVLSLLQEQGQLEKQLEELQDNLILEAKVVATTLTKSYASKVVLSRQYDCVIIDEASMAPLPAVFCASGLAQSNVVIVGDFLQLPPVAQYKLVRTKYKSEEQSNEEQRLVQDWLLRDIFSVAGIEQAIKEGIKPQKLTQLKRQYRMHKTIADMVNDVVYARLSADYALETDDNTEGNEHPELLDLAPSEGSHIALYDTSKRAPIASIIGGGSYYNLYNALVCIEIAKQAVESGYEEIGIISGYRAQANLLQKMIKDTFKDKDAKKVVADTVHRFQGGEKQLIIFDITTPKTKSMYDDGEAGGNDMKLLNVAISRAKNKCVFVGDLKQIGKSHSSSSSVMEALVHMATKRYPLYDTEEFLGSFQATEKADAWLRKLASSDDISIEMGKSELFDEKNFYGAFINDMLSAEKEIIIDSPYITTRRVDELYKYFEQVRHKGIDVYLLTRVSKEQDSKMQYYSDKEIERLSGIGIKVLPFMGKIHRKLAIIDRKILWEGSLNILSQNDSTEVMRRFEGEESSKQMVSFLKLDKNLGDIGAEKLQHCEFCDSPMAWYWTDVSFFGGLWTYCLFKGHKKGAPPKTSAQITNSKDKLRKARKAIKEKASDGSPICPNHGLVMVKRTGRFGEFYGCPRYPACKITDKIK